jgi:hypothetical protein
VTWDEFPDDVFFGILGNAGGGGEAAKNAKPGKARARGARSTKPARTRKGPGAALYVMCAV